MERGGGEGAVASIFSRIMTKMIDLHLITQSSVGLSTLLIIEDNHYVFRNIEIGLQERTPEVKLGQCLHVA